MKNSTLSIFGVRNTKFLANGKRQEVRVRNKVGRLEGPSATNGELTKPLAQCIRGKLFFARGQSFERLGAHVFHSLGQVIGRNDALRDGERARSKDARGEPYNFATSRACSGHGRSVFAVRRWSLRA